MRVSRSARAMRLAVTTWPLVGGEREQLFWAWEAVVELPGLAGPELFSLWVGDQQWRGDLLYLLTEAVGADALIEGEAGPSVEAVGLAPRTQRGSCGRREHFGEAHLAVK